MAQQLKETTMSPLSRSLIKVALLRQIIKKLINLFQILWEKIRSSD